MRKVGQSGCLELLGYRTDHLTETVRHIQQVVGAGGALFASGVRNQHPAVGTRLAFITDDAREALALTRVRIATSAQGELGVAVAELTSALAVIPESGRAAFAFPSSGSVAATALACVVVALRSFGGFGAVARPAAAAAVEPEMILFAAVAFLSDHVRMAEALAVRVVALGRSAFVAVAALAVLQVHSVTCCVISLLFNCIDWICVD